MLVSWFFKALNDLGRLYLVELLHFLNSGTQCHVRSLLQIACLLSKIIRSARRVITY